MLSPAVMLHVCRHTWGTMSVQTAVGMFAMLCAWGLGGAHEVVPLLLILLRILRAVQVKKVVLWAKPKRVTHHELTVKRNVRMPSRLEAKVPLPMFVKSGPFRFPIVKLYGKQWPLLLVFRLFLQGNAHQYLAIHFSWQVQCSVAFFSRAHGKLKPEETERCLNLHIHCTCDSSKPEFCTWNQYNLVSMISTVEGQYKDGESLRQCRW